jgi:hypothetical protein
LNEHRVSEVRQIEIHTAESLVPDPSPFGVEIFVSSLKNYKSPGIDQIPAELIQIGDEILRHINYIWNKEELPDQWKESIIVPVHKQGHKTDCSNYRGISLLSASHTILPNILPSRLSTSTYIVKITGDHQCGFRRNRSTTDQIFHIRQILEKKCEYNETVHQIFLYLKKAYESVRKEVLYNILLEFVALMELVKLIKMCLNET